MAKQGRGISRREFARRAAAGAAAAIVPGGLLGEVNTASRADVASASLQQDTKLSEASQAEVDAKVATILRRYGSRFNEAQKADIRRLVTEGQKPLETMRAFALDNADQPANVMRIYPDGAATGVARR